MEKYTWHLHDRVKAQRLSVEGVQRALRGRGLRRSRAQVHRDFQEPKRLTLQPFVAYCHVLHCTPNDLIEINPDQPSARPTRKRSLPPRFRPP